MIYRSLRSVWKGSVIWVLSKYGFQKIEDFSSFTDTSGIDTIFFPVTDAPDFPQEVRAKAEELIDRVLEQYRAEHDREPVCEQMELSASMEIYFTGQKPFYHIQVGVIDFTNEVSNWTEYIIDIGDPIYQTFREYIMQQLDKGLFA